MGLVKPIEADAEWRELWNTQGRRLRYFLCWPQIIGFALFASILLMLSVFWQPAQPFCPSDYDYHLYCICILGTIAELGLNLGYMWFSSGLRTLPYWGIEITSSLSLRPICSFLLKHQRIQNLLVGLLLAGLILMLLIPGIAPSILLPTVILFAFLCLSDLWRLFYYNYCLFALASFLFPHPQIAIQIILASIYFWSGFGKLCMPLFYEEVAPMTFEVINNLLERISNPLGLSAEMQKRMFTIIAAIGVLQEMLMGLVLFFPSMVPSWVLLAALSFNLFMHFYIVIFIGLANNIHTFISWNTWCLLLTQYIFSPSVCGLSIVSTTPWHSFHYLTFLVMTLPPLLMLFARCPHGTLSHSYFAPGWYPEATLFLPIRCIRNLPAGVNGQELRYYTHGHRTEGFQILLQYFTYYLPTKNEDKERNMALRRGFLLDGETEEETKELSDAQFFETRCVAIDDSWFNWTFNYGPKDPAQEYYGPAHASFWRQLVAEYMPRDRNNAFLLRRMEFSLLHKGFFKTYVMKL